MGEVRPQAIWKNLSQVEEVEDVANRVRVQPEHPSMVTVKIKDVTTSKNKILEFLTRTWKYRFWEIKTNFFKTILQKEVPRQVCNYLEPQIVVSIVILLEKPAVVLLVI